MPVQQVIHIHAEAPTKPPMGAACNGCGVCCLAEPCPLGMLLSLRRSGPCKMLQWSDASRQYRCGALGAPDPQGRASLRSHWVARWIAAGSGCDCNLEMPGSSTMAVPLSQEAPHD